MRKRVLIVTVMLMLLISSFSPLKALMAFKDQDEQNIAIYAAMVLWDASSGLPSGWYWNVPGITPVLYTKIPLDYPSTSFIYVVFGDDNNFYISEDKKFDDPASPTPDEVASPGDYITLFDEDAEGVSLIKDEMGNIITQSGKYVSFVGRTFQIGWVDFNDSGGNHEATFPTDLNGANPSQPIYWNSAADNNIGDILLFYEVLDTTKDYQIFAVSDAGRLILSNPPPVTFPPFEVSINDIVSPITWVPDQNFGYASFYNIHISYRGTIPVEWWYDNGENNVNGGPALPFSAFGDQKDNYSFTDMTCERFLGGTDKSLHEADWGIKLYPFNSDEMFYDLDGGGTYNYKEAIYKDNDTSGDISPGDERLTPISPENMPSGFSHTYPAGSIVQAGDEDTTLASITLTPFNPDEKHTGSTSGYVYLDWQNDGIYRDNDGDGYVSGGDVRISGYGDYTPGTTVLDPLDLINEDPIDGISNEERFSFIYSIVGVSNSGVDVEFTTNTNEENLKVEDTINITVRYSPGINGWVILTLPDGYSIYRQIPSTGEVEFTSVSLWRGGKLTIRVFSDNVSEDGLMDGVYGSWVQRDAPSTTDVQDTYDFYFIKRWDINTEDLLVYLDRECIHPYDTHYPNLHGWAEDKQSGLTDPYGTIVGEDIYFAINATTDSGSISFISVSTSKDILQFDETHRIVHVWNWSDADSDNVIDEGEAVTYVGTQNAKYVDENENEIVDNGDTFRDINTNAVIFTIDHLYEYVGVDTSTGEFPIVIHGTGRECEEIKVEVYGLQVIFDYNNMDPTYSFVLDPANPSASGFNENPPHVWVMAPDYYGETTVISQPIEEINFVNVLLEDEGLKYSTYPNPYPPYGNPNYPFAPTQRPFDVKWLRTYPGGQYGNPNYNTVPLVGSGYLLDETENPGTGPSPVTDLVIGPWGNFTGLNARHAQYAWLDKHPPYIHYLFEKLGSAMHPLTDYWIEFSLTDRDGNILTPSDIQSIEIIGEKVSGTGQAVFVTRLPDGPYTYNGVSNLPKRYDYSGYLYISNTTIPSLSDYFDNSYFSFDIIPTSWGKLRIKVTDIKGNTYEYKYCSCCKDNPPGIDVLGIEINNAPRSLTVDEETEFTVQLKEYSAWQVEEKVNNALVFVWQDRGVYDPDRDVWYGVGDGWITGSPYVKTSVPFYVPLPYNAKDWNDDGKISFDDGETEIMGDFDIATGTWSVRGNAWVTEQTFQVNNGEVTFTITPHDVGFDFNGDGIIDRIEEIPVRITAYQFADDGSFAYDSTHGWMMPKVGASDGAWQPWEVFIAGEAFIPVVGKKEINIEVKPQPLTAGTVAECLNPDEPLTFVVDYDLSKGVNGITVSDEDIWKFLFEDPRPSPLPETQYYWLRTSLHNEPSYLNPMYVVLPDGDTGIIGASNQTIYDPLFNPISFSREGDNYIFKGFIANDEGKFKVYVYSPDRKKYGVAEVEVKLPHIKWDIKNTEDENETVFSDPDDDFILTAGDNRIYDITGTVYDARGNLIKICETECGIPQGCPIRVTLFTSFTPHYPMFEIFDFDEDGKDEAVDFSWIYNNPDTWEIIYNKSYNYDKWNYGHLFLDNPMKPDGNLITSKDSLTVDCNGQFHFKIFPTDVGFISALVGVSYYYDTNFGDVGGKFKPPSPTSENPPPYPSPGIPPTFDESFNIFTKFEPDELFYLDWDAHADSKIEVSLPMPTIYIPKTHLELSKNLLDPENYDLTFGMMNWIKVKMDPADERDLPIKEGQIQIVGNDGPWVDGTYDKDYLTDLKFEPHGTGKRVAVFVWSSLDTVLKNIFNIDDEAYDFQFIYDDTPPYPWFLMSDLFPWSLISVNRHLSRINEIIRPVTAYDLPRFDSARGLEIIPKLDRSLEVGVEVNVTLKVQVAGSEEPIEGASVDVRSSTLIYSGKTDADGIVKFSFTPSDETPLVITAMKEDYVKGYKVLEIGKDITPPVLTFDEIPKKVNDNVITLTGTVTDNSGEVTLTVNGVEATINEDGTFSVTITLVEGENEVVAVAVDKEGNKTENKFVIYCDTKGPNITLETKRFVFSKNEEIIKVKLAGYVDTDTAAVIVKTEDDGFYSATIVHNVWIAEDVILKRGINKITLVVTDTTGNEVEIQKEVYIYTKTVIIVQPDNTQAIIDGNTLEMDVSPYIKEGRILVPIRFIAEAFGAKVEWIQETQSVIVEFNGHMITLKIGVPEVVVDGEVIHIGVPPEINHGRTMVPLRVIAEGFGAEVKWYPGQRKAVISLEYLEQEDEP